MCKEKVENEEGWKDDDDTREKSKDRYRRRAPEPEGLFRHIDGPCVHAGLMHASRLALMLSSCSLPRATSIDNLSNRNGDTSTQSRKGPDREELIVELQSRCFPPVRRVLRDSTVHLILCQRNRFCQAEISIAADARYVYDV